MTKTSSSNAAALRCCSDWGVAGAGGVQVYPSPHDVTDCVPSRATPASGFVPMFAPVNAPRDRGNHRMRN